MISATLFWFPRIDGVVGLSGWSSIFIGLEFDVKTIIKGMLQSI